MRKIIAFSEWVVEALHSIMEYNVLITDHEHHKNQANELGK